MPTPADPDLWTNAQEQLAAIARRIGIDGDIVTLLADCKRSTVVSVPVRLDGGSVDVFEGYRVVHNVARGPSLGGTRYHPGLTLEQTKALAMQMTWKCALMNLPFGGAQGGVCCDPKSLSAAEVERLTRRYTSEIVGEIGPEVDVPAPDLGTGPREMAWLFDTYSMTKGYSVLGVVTGKPLELGGSVGRVEAPARGAFVCLREALRKRGQMLAGTTVAIQGFGTVGQSLAGMLAEAGARIVALADSGAGVFRSDGIDVGPASAHKGEAGTLAGLAGAEPITQEELLALPCDVLVPAALQRAITAGNAEQVRAKVVLEGASAPLTSEVDATLAGRGVLVLPDLLANAGSVVVSYFEWVQGLQEYFWKEAEVNARLEEILARAFEETWAEAEARRLTLRDAAYALAVGRVADATATRGLYP